MTDSDDAYLTWRATGRPTRTVLSFTCPVCGRTSYNANDVQYGYCGKCHAFTGGEDA